MNVECSIRAVFKKKSDKKKLLILKFDALGDYILFRNFLKPIAESTKYSNYEITLLGNENLEELSKIIDSDALANSIYINPKDYKNGILKTIDLIRKLSNSKYDTIINYHSSRNVLSDIIICSLKAYTKIGFKSNDISNSRTLIYFKVFCNFFYTKLFKVQQTFCHEFERNKSFCENLLNNNNLPIAQLPVIAQKDLKIINNNISPITLGLAENNYLVVAIGAGANARKLSNKKMLGLLQNISKKYFLPVVFVGTKADVAVANLLISEIHTKIPWINLCGKTNILQIVSLVANAQAIICYDSGIYHIAKSLNKPNICIAGGGHFSRFVNYKLPSKNTFFCYENMLCFDCDWKCIYAKKENDSYNCLNKISDDQIKISINNLFFYLNL